MAVQLPPWLGITGFGGLIAVLVIIAAFVLWLMKLMDGPTAGCVAALGLARLLP